MSKHTPGPWMLPHFANPESKCDCGYVLNEDYMGCIAEVKYSVDGDQADNPPWPEAQANARLIAAAPDLLEALQELIAMDEAQVFVKDPWDASFAKAKAAVAKARGAS